MHHTNMNMKTGEIIETPVIAYKNSNNELLILDVDVEPPDGYTKITDDEAIALNAQLATQIPNPQGFIEDVKTAFGGIAGLMPIAAIATLFFTAVNAKAWGDVQTIVIAARDTNAINDARYVAIKAAAVSNNIPITLP